MHTLSSVSPFLHHLATHLRHQATSLSSFPLRSTLLTTLSIHAFLLKSGNLYCSPFPSLLLSSYSSLSPPLSLSLFRTLPSGLLSPRLFSSLLSPLSRSHPSLSLPFFPLLLSHSFLDPFLLSSLIKSCSSLRHLSLGKQSHCIVVLCGAWPDPVVQSSLVDMYCKCGATDYACKVFNEIVEKNMVVWTAMVSGYATNGRLEDALGLFSQMPVKNLFAWTALISGFFRSGEWLSGVKVFNEMRKEGVTIDDCFVISCVIAGASHLYSLAFGKQLHGLVFKLGFWCNTIIGNALLDMYSKCSSITSARKVFDEIPAKDVVSWTTMLVGEAQHGRAEETLSLFDKMTCIGIVPNEVTFIGLIYACSHAGFVQKGRELFDSMVRDYHIEPKLQHYTCLLDLLSRSGHLSEAEDIISSMPCSPDETTWTVLLSACNKHKDMDIGIRLSHHLLELKPKDPSIYVLMSNAFAVAGKWDYVAKVRTLMDELGTLKKEPGYTWVEVGNENCIFYAGEAPYKLKKEIQDLLGDLEREIRQIGYVPDTSFVMHDLEEVEKVHQLSMHSERLAVAYGLLRSVPGSVIRLVKNLRICGDCHAFLKFVSDLKKRKIVVRDASRFHHFENGSCSCGDFW